MIFRLARSKLLQCQLVSFALVQVLPGMPLRPAGPNRANPLSCSTPGGRRLRPFGLPRTRGRQFPFPRRHGLWLSARRARKTRRGAVGTGRRACSASRPASSSRSTIFCSGQIVSITLILKSLPLNMVRYACPSRFRPVCGAAAQRAWLFSFLFLPMRAPED